MSLRLASNVWLTGLRGLLTPVLGVVLIHYLESLAPGRGVYAMLLPLSLTLLGWFWFIRLHAELQRRPPDLEP